VSAGAITRSASASGQSSGKAGVDHDPGEFGDAANRGQQVGALCERLARIGHQAGLLPDDQSGVEAQSLVASHEYAIGDRGEVAVHAQVRGSAVGERNRRR
jgi:hypothetical protein